MMNIIKTAIITIIISIISGLLLDYFKNNLCPKILCNMGNAIPTEKDNKKVYAYIIDVYNQSNKIIHELTLNIHSLESNLKFENAKITKGLKFESSIKNNVLDIYIPFLSKGDKFSVTVYVESCNKPLIAMRSPENFKEINPIVGEKNFLSPLFNKHKNKNVTNSKSMIKNNRINSDKKNDFTMVMDKVSESDKPLNNKNRNILHRSNKINKNKKIIIAAVSISLVVVMGALIKFYFNGNSNNKQAPSIKTSVPKKSNDSKGQSDGINKNIDSNKESGESSKNTDSKSSNGKTNKNINTNSKSSTRVKTKDSNSNLNSKDSGTNKNVDSKSSQDKTNENIDSKPSTDRTNENTDSKASTDETIGNEDSNTSTNKNTGNESK